MVEKKSLTEEWDSFAKMYGHSDRFSFSVDVNSVIGRINAFFNPEKKTDGELVWIYECCKKPGPEAYLSDPYCPECGGRLVRLEKENG